MQETKILLVEDNPGDALLIKETLRFSSFKDATLLLSESMESALAMVSEDPVLLLVDLGLPDSDGLDTVRSIRSGFPDSALIVLTGLDDENIAVETLREGAQNYLSKDEITSELLDRTIRFSLERHDIIQKLKTTDKELLQSKYFLEKAQELAHIGSWVADLVKNTAEWSDETQRIFGFQPGEFDSKVETFVAMVHPVDVSALREKLNKAIAEKHIFDNTHRIIRKDGVVRWIHAQAEIFFDEMGQAVSMIGSAQDITEMKEAEAKIFKGNRLYSLISHINQAIVHCKEEKTLFSEACQIAVEQGKFAMAWIGLSREEGGVLDLIAHYGGNEGDAEKLSPYTFGEESPFEQIVKGLDYYVIRDLENEPGLNWAKYSAERGFRSVMILALKKNRKTIGVFTIVSAETDFFDAEEVKMLQEVADDVSFALDILAREQRRKQAEERLLRSEASLKEAQEIARIGSGEIDLQNNTVIWSEGLYKLFGVDTSVPSSMDLFFNHVYEDDKAGMVRVLENVQESHSDITSFFRFVRADGEVRYASAEYKFELDHNNNPVRLYGIIQDMTNQRKADEEKEKIISDIVQRNKDLEQFAYIVSHNLRLPVANIIGFSDLLKNDVLNKGEQLVSLEALHSSVVQLDEVVRDLNQVLQLKREINENREKIVLPTLLDKVKESIQNLIDKEQAIIEADFSAIKEVVTIKSYMHSVFYNLIVNSLKYRRQGVPLHMEIRSAIEGNKIILSFKDNGSGIDLDKNKDHLFGLYKRFHSHVEGKGMGLFMVKTQVEALGGKIRVVSEVNIGTEFIVEFEKDALI